MTENKKMIPETTESESLTDDQLDEVSGGGLPLYTRCSADSSHVYPAKYSKCPICGAKQ